MDQFVIILSKIQSGYLVYLMITARFFGIMYIFPLFSKNYMTSMLKIVLSLTFALIVFPAYTSLNMNQNIVLSIFYMAKEFILGVMIGYVVSIPLWAIEACGNLIDTQRGEQMGAIVSNSTGNPSSSIGKLILWAFFVYFITINGLLFVLEFAYRSFTIFPIDSVLPLISEKFAVNYIDLFKSFFMWSIILALPVVILMFVVELILGLISSFLPQTNVTVLSMPIKSSVGIFVLIIYMGVLFNSNFSHFLEKIKGFYA
jgi:type III secretion protein T